MSEQKEVVSIKPIIDNITFTPDILEIKPQETIKDEVITEKEPDKREPIGPSKLDKEDDNTENYFTIFGTILITSGLGYLFR